jgi:xanthine dehydrogenase accessory factor
VENNGMLTGAISGGCLEGDALRKALLAIEQKQNKLVSYNTLDEDDVQFGVQLGCNGIVHILFEPIDPTDENNPIALLEKCVVQRNNAVLVTLFSLKNYHGHQAGTCFLESQIESRITQRESQMEGMGLQIAQMKKDVGIVLETKSSLLKQYEDDVTGFVEFIEPVISLVIVGAGNDAIPLMEMASVLGWDITVVDGRKTHATKQRFSKAGKIIVSKPAEVLKQIETDERTVFVLMTHNYNYDLALMKFLSQEKCSYIGILGPQKRLDRLLSELADQGVTITDEQRAAIYGPTGLDIGAEAAEEIALSVLAEIKAVLAKREGRSLRERLKGIHADSFFATPDTNKIE